MPPGYVFDFGDHAHPNSHRRYGSIQVPNLMRARQTLVCDQSFGRERARRRVHRQSNNGQSYLTLRVCGHYHAMLLRVLVRCH